MTPSIFLEVLFVFVEPPCSGNEPSIDNCDCLMLKCSHQRTIWMKRQCIEWEEKSSLAQYLMGLIPKIYVKNPKNQISQTKLAQPVRWANEMDTKFSTVLLQLSGKYMIKVFRILSHCTWGNENLKLQWDLLSYCNQNGYH